MSQCREREKEGVCRGAEKFRHLMSDPRLMAAPARKEALDLLLYPDGVELNRYYLSMASCLHKFRIRMRDIPEPLLKVFCELLASAGRIFRGPDAHEFFIRLLFKIPPNLLAWLFEKRFPLRPFIDHIDAKRIFPGIAQPSQVLRKRWRMLRKRLISGLGAACSLPDLGLETTLWDLRFLKAARRSGRVKSAWRIHGKAVAAKAAIALRDAPAQTMRRLYWGGERSRKIAFWEKLIQNQAGELLEIRRLSREVSSRTGRVVLSWHNASLGAAGGWALEDFAAQFASPALYSVFVHGVLKEAAEIRKSFDIYSAMSLCAMRSERIFAPKAAGAVDHSLISALFTSCRRPIVAVDGSCGPAGIKEPESPLLKESANRIANGNKYEWPGPLSPHQSISTEQVLAWSEKAHKTWADGLILLFALANQGQRMLDSGKIPSLVLPWIDKFFISSRRRADVTYLERLFRLASANIRKPLILLWDDTSHGKVPSLGLALEDLAGRGLPFRAIGIFDTGVSLGGLHGAERAGATRIILNDYPQKALFALRPLNENHCPDAFRWIFKDLDMKFFLNYDSSWKDNLAFIYTGTQVFPLLSVQTEMEAVSPWVFDGRERFAFGAWFRRRLRHISLGKLEGISDPLCLEYCSWANLL
ncbi:MAG: hypothetical protein ABSF52_08560 [Syntrophobacteraceae bacterium]